MWYHLRCCQDVQNSQFSTIKFSFEVDITLQAVWINKQARKNQCCTSKINIEILFFCPFIFWNFSFPVPRPDIFCALNQVNFRPLNLIFVWKSPYRRFRSTNKREDQKKRVIVLSSNSWTRSWNSNNWEYLKFENHFFLPSAAPQRVK